MTHQTFCQGLFFSQYCRKPLMTLLPESWPASICTDENSNKIKWDLVLYSLKYQRFSINTSSSPPGCPSSFLRPRPLPSGWRNSLCRLCWLCFHHTPEPPYCLNIYSIPPVKKIEISHSYRQPHHITTTDSKPFIRSEVRGLKASFIQLRLF